MTPQEWAKLAMAIKATYKTSGILEDKASIEVWYSLLSDLDYQICSRALMQWMQTEHFPPTIADIRAGASRIVNGEALNDGEAWAMVAKAISRSGYYAQEEFDKLPPAVQAAVGSPDVLRTWALSEDYSQDVAMSNFKKAYKVALERHIRTQNTAPSLLTQIEQMRFGRKEQNAICYSGQTDH